MANATNPPAGSECRRARLIEVSELFQGPLSSGPFFMRRCKRATLAANACRQMLSRSRKGRRNYPAAPEDFMRMPDDQVALAGTSSSSSSSGWRSAERDRSARRRRAGSGAGRCHRRPGAGGGGSGPARQRRRRRGIDDRQDAARRGRLRGSRTRDGDGGIAAQRGGRGRRSENADRRERVDRLRGETRSCNAVVDDMHKTHDSSKSRLRFFLGTNDITQLPTDASMLRCVNALP